MSNLITAIKLATDGHSLQKDLAGQPYILHPLAVMMAFEFWPEKYKIVAVLHDIIEDTAIRPDNLRVAWGFSDEIVEALEALTKRDDEKYFDYIKRVMQNKIAIEVKKEDLKHNLSRCERYEHKNIFTIEEQEKFSSLRKRYVKALNMIYAGGN